MRYKIVADALTEGSRYKKELVANTKAVMNIGIKMSMFEIDSDHGGCCGHSRYEHFKIGEASGRCEHCGRSDQ